MIPCLPWPSRMALAGALVLLGACSTAGEAPAPGPMPAAQAPPLQVGLLAWSVRGTARSDPRSCQDPHNVWTGRFAARANSWAGQGGGTGQSLVACFPTAEACSAWLGGAIGASQGIISVQSCAREGAS